MPCDDLSSRYLTRTAADEYIALDRHISKAPLISGALLIQQSHGFRWSHIHNLQVSNQ